MLLRLVGECLTHEWREWHSGAEWTTQIHLVVAKQTGAKAAIRGETHAIATTAIRVCHRRDDADAPRRPSS